jgi:hypothetical protein
MHFPSAHSENDEIYGRLARTDDYLKNINPSLPAFHLFASPLATAGVKI